MTSIMAADRESRRLAALASYAILDTPPEQAFDEVAELAAQVCGTPIAVVNLIGDGRQFFKAEVGLGVQETPLETSFCAKAILEEDFLIIPDATLDPRFDCNPLVTGHPGLRFYAGALLKTAEGLPIGTLCVLDTTPHDLSALQRQTLKVLAHQVMAQLELRLSLSIRHSSEARHRAIVESATDYAIIATDLAGRITEWNTGAERILLWSEGEMIGESAERFFTPEDRAAGIIEQEMRSAVTRGRGVDERWHMRKTGERFWASGEMMPLREDGDRLIGYIKILRDRTQEKLHADRLAASEERLRASQRAGRIGTFEVNLRTGAVTVTPEFCALFGVRYAGDLSAEQFEALVLPADRHLVSNQLSRAQGHVVTEVEYRIARADDGEVRWIARQAQFTYDAEGTVITMLGMVQDITARKQAERRVNAQLGLGDRLRDAGSVEEVIKAVSEALGTTLDGDRAGYALVHHDRGVFDVEHVWVAQDIPPLTGQHDLARFAATVRALSNGGVLAIDDIEGHAELLEDRLTYGSMATRAQIMVPLVTRGVLVGVLFLHSRNPRAWHRADVNFARNIADRAYAAIAKLQAEAEQALLNQELSHRLKNTLAMVQAIAGQTLKSVTERDAVTALTARIAALSSAHDILMADNWRRARLDHIAQAVADLHSHGDQVEIAGPPVELSPRAGLSASLLLHELATNAVKYGALSRESGRVSLCWRIVRDQAQLMLTLEWIESGGPEVLPPTRKGFGSRLIKSGLAGSGAVEIDYAPAGLRARFTAPFAVLEQD